MIELMKPLLRSGHLFFLVPLILAVALLTGCVSEEESLSVENTVPPVETDPSAGAGDAPEPASDPAAPGPAATDPAADSPGPAAPDPAVEAVTMASLLDEMVDMARLARLDAHPFRTVQYSSYDRRSVSPDGEAWFSNADGFGGEPIPGFEAVLAEANGEGIGTYLLCDVNAPGAIVRGWSAGMGGTLRVFLDGAEAPIYEGPAYEFLARRSEIFFRRAGIKPDCGDGFMQQDSDYFPVPFSRKLRITWEGKLKELHFYHLQVRLYDRECPVATFDFDRDVAALEETIVQTAHRLANPVAAGGRETVRIDASVAPGSIWNGPELPAGPGAITSLTLRVGATDRERALRGTVLRIGFDGAQRSQVAAPVGDFFGAGPGVHPYSSLPMSVEPDGTMTCRFVMPFKKSASLTLQNLTDTPVVVTGSLAVAPWKWDSRSCYFRARWRVDHDLDPSCPIDMPYVVLRGTGRFVGCAVQVANPSPVPTPYGSWWGEGDEKVFIDQLPFPCAFGTGSEDYFNYSWSRPDLFDHPFCGQPLDSGPGNSGYVTNYRWQILDAIPFESFFAFYMELWHHHPFPGLSYGRAAYLYARPGAVDDHRRILADDARVPALIPMEPRPILGAVRSTFHSFEAMSVTAAGGGVKSLGEPAPSTMRPVVWNAEKGGRLTTSIRIDEDGKYRLNLVGGHRPEGGVARFLLDGAALTVSNLGGAETGERGSDLVSTRSHFVARRLSTGFSERELKAGEHELVIECAEKGIFRFEYLWIKRVDR